MKHLLKNTFLLFVSLFLTQIAMGQTGFDYNKPLKNQTGIIKKLTEDITIIILEGNDSKRYIASNLPFEYKKEGLKVKFNALESAIPPYIRMAGAPIQLSCIKVTSADKKKFDLTKKKYSFKKK